MKSGDIPSHRLQSSWLISSLLFVLLFWSVLFFRIPPVVSQYFHRYSPLLFVLILVLYYFSFRFEQRYGIAACLGLTMAFTALSLSYIWSSGFSDNFIISSLLPYKDAKNYFTGAQLLLNGLPLVNAGQATERPLFPSFLAGILWLTGQNLELSLAIITQLIGLGIYFSSKQIHASLGSPAASLFATLLYFYVQPLIGYTMSETLGFIAGCFGFALIWSAAQRRRWIDLVIGILILLIAVSARAGAFFTFPLLALWVGWIFRGEERFSLRAFGYALFGILVGYFLINSVYARILGVPPGSSFANFSYALYGQVRGGTGWHSAIEILGTRDASVVYRAAWNFFLEHPLSLLIGFAKSYRDFFVGTESIFPFGEFGLQNGFSSLMWVITLVLLVTGLILSAKKIRDSLSALILAGFIGTFLSIPFLPPIDGGSRFYAATVPFFTVLSSFGIHGFHGRIWTPPSLHDNGHSDAAPSRYIAVALMVFTLVLPLLLFLLVQKPVISSTPCLSGQEPFYIEYHLGSCVDSIRPGSQSCGFVPDVCQDDFQRNNTEKSNDDFYQTLFRFMENEESNVRIIPALNLLDGKFHYFYATQEQFAGRPESGWISGCAEEVLTKNQTIFKVQSFSLIEK